MTWQVIFWSYFFSITLTVFNPCSSVNAFDHVAFSDSQAGSKTITYIGYYFLVRISSLLKLVSAFI